MNKLYKVFRFYRDGFAGMTVGKSLWLLIIIKVAIMFLVLKLFFFPNVVNDESRAKGIAPSEVVKSTLLHRTINTNQ